MLHTPFESEAEESFISFESDEDFDEEVLLEEVEEETDDEPPLRKETASDFIIKQARKHTLLSQRETRLHILHVHRESKLLLNKVGGIRTIIYKTERARNALDMLVYHNQRLALSMAFKFLVRGMLDLPDLHQEACRGIIHAVFKFDLMRKYNGKHVQFSTYATYWMQHYVRRALVNTGRARKLPPHFLNKLLQLERTYALHRQVSQRSLNCFELAELCNMTVDEVLSCKNIREPDISLDRPQGEDDKLTLLQLVESRFVNPADYTEMSADNEQLYRALSKLPREDAAFIMHRFGIIDGCVKSLAQVAHLYRMSEELAEYKEKLLLKQLSELIDPAALNQTFVGKRKRQRNNGSTCVSGSIVELAEVRDLRQQRFRPRPAEDLVLTRT